MEINEALKFIEAGTATTKVVDDMLLVKVKQFNPDTGKTADPIKEYFSIKELQNKKENLTKKLTQVTSLLASVNL